MSDNKHSSLIIIHLPSRRFKWDTVTTFSQNEEVHSLAVNDLVTQLERANISCTATITFGEANFKDQLTLLRVCSTTFATTRRLLRVIWNQLTNSRCTNTNKRFFRARASEPGGKIAQLSFYRRSNKNRRFIFFIETASLAKEKHCKYVETAQYITNIGKLSNVAQFKPFYMWFFEKKNFNSKTMFRSTKIKTSHRSESRKGWNRKKNSAAWSLCSWRAPKPSKFSASRKFLLMDNS